MTEQYCFRQIHHQQQIVLNFGTAQCLYILHCINFTWSITSYRRHLQLLKEHLVQQVSLIQTGDVDLGTPYLKDCLLLNAILICSDFELSELWMNDFGWLVIDKYYWKLSIISCAICACFCLIVSCALGNDKINTGKVWELCVFVIVSHFTKIVYL